MINKALAAITSADIDALLSNAVAEGKTLDYKRDLPGGTDSDKKEFLADVSSFANSVGGDLIFGIEENAGVPTAIVGLADVDPDAEIRRLDDMIAAGIAPRLRHSIRRLTHESGVGLLLLRVERSWNAPHRVVFKGHDRFYARNSAGKYSLDVSELRDAFLLSSAVVDRMRDFHSERLLDIASERIPTPLAPGARLVVHLLPLSTFASPEQLDIAPAMAAPDKMLPMSGTGWNHRITLEGFLTFAQVNTTSLSYTHLYRNGIVEAVDAYVLNREHNGRREIPAIAYEARLIEHVGKYLRVQEQIGVVPPVYVLIALLGAKGCWMVTGPEFYDLNDRYPIDRDPLLLPPVVVHSYNENVAATLRPAVDAVWHACGYGGSPNFDATGNWNRT